MLTKLSTLDDLRAKGLFAMTANIDSDGSRPPCSHECLGEIDRALLEHLATYQYAEFLRLAVQHKQNILISGATGSGKTTIFKALACEIPRDERLLVLEDAPELDLLNLNRLQLECSQKGSTKVTADDVLETGICMHPDRILLQELDVNAAYNFVLHASARQRGSITSVHASTAMLAFEQLTFLVKHSAGGKEFASADIRNLLWSAIDVVVQCKHASGRFHVSEIYFDPRRKNATLDTGPRSIEAGAAL